MPADNVIRFLSGAGMIREQLGRLSSYKPCNYCSGNRFKIFVFLIY